MTLKMTGNSTNSQYLDFTMVEVIIVTFQMIIMILIVSGNILVLCAFKTFHHLQTSTGKFIANLAVADLCLGLTMPFQISFFFHPEMSFIKEACLLRFEVIIFTSTSSLLSLFFTVVDRHIAVLYPLRYHSIMSWQRANTLICIVWTYAATLALIPLLGYNSFPLAPICVYELVMWKSYRLVVALHFIVLPIIMFIIYCRVFIIAWSLRKKITGTNCVGSFNINVRIQRETKTAAIMAIVMLAFSLCWLPFAFIQVIQAVEFNDNQAFISNFLVFLGVLNSIINPIIYVWKNKQYKTAFKKIICICKRFDQVMDINSFSLNNSPGISQMVNAIPLQEMKTK